MPRMAGSLVCVEAWRPYIVSRFGVVGVQAAKAARDKQLQDIVEHAGSRAQAGGGQIVSSSTRDSRSKWNRFKFKKPASHGQASTCPQAGTRSDCELFLGVISGCAYHFLSELS